MSKTIYFIVFIALTIPPNVCFAQHRLPDTITAFKINDKLGFDGKLTEPASCCIGYQLYTKGT